MFGPMIDVYHDEISSAIASGDSMAVARIAEAFCERCHYWRPWKIVGIRSHVCPIDGLQAIVDISFHDENKAQVCIWHKNGRRRLTVNGDDVSCQSSADVVHILETPCAFFDGIYYAIEGLVEVAKGQLAEQIGKLDAQFNDYRQRCDNEFAIWGNVQKKVEAANKNLLGVYKKLATAVSACNVAQETQTFTVRPIDMGERILDASRMVDVPVSEFFSVFDCKQRLAGKSGIYFAWRMSDGKCVYVGKSVDLGSRIHPGRSELVDCRITVLEMPERHIHTWELFFIWLHMPERNIEVRLSGEKTKQPKKKVVANGR